MSFLFGKKKGDKSVATTPTRDVYPPSAGPIAAGPALNGARPKERGPGVISPGPNGPAHIAHEGKISTVGEQVHENIRGDMDRQITPPRTVAPAQAPSVNPAALYPWSKRHLTFTSAQPSPFPRYGAAVNAVASKEGEIYMMGGLVDGATVKGDLWMIECGGANLTTYPVGTTFEGPGPRVGHASLLVGNACIVFGGDTKLDERDKLDDTLYLLNTNTRHWSRSVPNGFRPSGRYGHTLNLLGSKIYVFGGQVEGYFFNDLLSFDLNALQQSNSKWEMIFPSSTEGGPPEGVLPPARTNHTIISWNNKLFLFGGTNGTQWFSDVWCYDPETVKWSQLDCIGYIPAAREGHSAALIGDVMYIFGGRTEEGTDLGDLAAFKITTRRWFTFQNMGPSPSARSGHSMTAWGKQIIVLAGEPSSAPRDPEELGWVYILDTAKIRYPNDQQIQQTPVGERVPGNRRPSQDRGMPGGQQKMINSMHEAPDSLARKQSGARESVAGQTRSPGPGSRIPEPNSASRLPRTVNGLQSSAPGAIPRNMTATPTGELRSRTPTRETRGPAIINDPSSRAQDAGTPEGTGSMIPSIAIKQGGPGSRSMSPAVNGRRTPVQQVASMGQHGQRMQSHSATDDDDFDPSAVRSRSRQGANNQSNFALPAADEAPSRTDGVSKTLPAYSGQNPAGSSQNKHDAVPVDQSRLHAQLEESRSVQQTQAQELEAAKNRNAWYASELALVKKAGYQPASAQNAILDERASQQFGEQDRPLVAALVTLRSQLSEIQGSVAARENAAAEQLAELEHQRDVAIKEAAYAKTKLAAHGGSHAGSPLPGATSSDAGDENRSNDIGRKLALSLAAQNELRATLDSLKNDLANERRAREAAEGTADAAHKRALDFEGAHNPGELENLRTELHVVNKSARENEATKSEAHARLRLLEVEKEDVSRNLADALENAKHHSNALSSLKEAVSSSTNKTSMLERKLEEERRQRENVDRRLLQLRAEHEETAAELEDTARRLRDAEEMAQTHAEEAKTHRHAVVAGLERLTSRSLESQNSMRGVDDQQFTILKQQLESSHGLVRKHQTEADDAADKLRKAEERIAGLETFQEQSSRESLSVRKQLQEALREAQNLRTKHATMQKAFSDHQQMASTLVVKHDALKDLLHERGLADTNSNAARSNTADSSRLKDLEEQLEASHRAHQETKETTESREVQTERTYREKLELLENDYQSAVHYVKGTEKMLKRMKDELTKAKKQNERLQVERDTAHESASRSMDAEGASQWEQEKVLLRQEISRLEQTLQESQSRTETQLAQLQGELHATTAEKERYQQSSEQFQQHLAQATEASQMQLDQIKLENRQLEARAQDAEQKVTLLLDQVGNSVTNYRRQSQQMHGAHVSGNGHSRNLSTISSSSSANPAPLNFAGGFTGARGLHSHTKSTDTADSSQFPPVPEASDESAGNNRNSLALDTLASELETLRSQWADSHRSYRLSNPGLDFDKSPISPPISANGPSNIMSDNLTNWRKRLDAEEAAAADKRSSSAGAALAGGKPVLTSAGLGALKAQAEPPRTRNRESAVIRQNDKMPGGLSDLTDDSEEDDDDEDDEDVHASSHARNAAIAGGYGGNSNVT